MEEQQPRAKQLCFQHSLHKNQIIIRAGPENEDRGICNLRIGSI